MTNNFYFLTLAEIIKFLVLFFALALLRIYIKKDIKQYLLKLLGKHYFIIIFRYRTKAKQKMH